LRSSESIQPATAPLYDRIALVTGGAKRIGRTLVLALAGAGARVVIHFRSSRQQAHQTAAEVAAAGGAAALLPGDLSDPSTASSLLQEAAAAFGRAPDILVNNASIFEQGSLADTTLDAWERHQAVNLRAPFLLSQAFARLLDTVRSGDIINLNDWRALRPGAGHFAYTSSKVALHGLTRSLALALAPRIKVNELALGAVLPPAKASDDYLHALKDEIPTRRFSKPGEVAQALLFLLGNPALTGQTICIDGGRHLV
jgi:NAD(P)-dependent dehydrogenase (short-subunit alcohol dehydrogenase family)